ncbi:MAG: cyclic nucleotide-binding domain-containing protein [Pontiella sp.]
MHRKLSAFPSVAYGVTEKTHTLQRHTGRSFDLMDAYANTIGVLSGGFVGLMTRGIISFIRKETAAKKVRDRLFSFQKDEVLIREGEPVEEMYIIKSGRLRATRTINGREVPVATLGAGEVVGVLGVVENKPQYSTIRALESTVVYRMDMKQLMESAGGNELPISLVLNGLCALLRSLADQLGNSGKSVDANSTLA